MSDEELIEKARHTHSSDFLDIGDLISQAVGPETKKRLCSIMVQKNHLDEYANGAL